MVKYFLTRQNQVKGGSSVLKNAQKVVADFNKEFNLPTEKGFENMKFYTLELAGEVGEMANIIKKMWRSGESEDLWEKLREEAADVLISYLLFLNSSGIDIDKAFEEKIEKLRVKFAPRKNLPPMKQW